MVLVELVSCDLLFDGRTEVEMYLPEGILLVRNECLYHGVLKYRLVD